MDEVPAWVAFLAGAGASYILSIVTVGIWMWIAPEFKEPE